jgi:hypothetical protein
MEDCLGGEDGFDKGSSTGRINVFVIPSDKFAGHFVLKRLEVHSFEFPNPKTVFPLSSNGKSSPFGKKKCIYNFTYTYVTYRLVSKQVFRPVLLLWDGITIWTPYRVLPVLLLWTAFQSYPIRFVFSICCLRRGYSTCLQPAKYICNDGQTCGSIFLHIKHIGVSTLKGTPWRLQGKAEE